MTEENPDEIIPISKTKRKKAMDALQDLGGELVELSNDQLKQLVLPDALLIAVKDAKKLTNARGAQKRQLQYIGRLMRDVDPEPIQAKLDAWNGVSKEQTIKLHLLERWRERLLETESALGEFLNSYPDVDVQYLRTLIRNAHKEKAANKPPKSSRALFQLLRETFEVKSGAKLLDASDEDEAEDADE